MNSLFRRIPANPYGRDFAVGDIHGHFELLDRLLDGIGFDPDRDRLFSLGDLVDRGPESPRAAEFLDREWFHAIRGNHEQMLLDAVAEAAGETEGGATALWRLNGGGWFFERPAAERAALCERVAALPVAMEVRVGNDAVGLVHGELPDRDWRGFADGLVQSGDDAPVVSREIAVWGRSSARAALRWLQVGSAGAAMAMAGIDRVLFGHTPMPCPIAWGNSRWLDTGAGHGGPLTLMSLARERL